MAKKITEFTFGGRACKAAPPVFSEEVCELVELFDEAGLSHDEGKPFRKNGKLMKLVRTVAKDCLKRGGHSDKEVAEILSMVEMDETSDVGVPALAEVLGLLPEAAKPQTDE